MGSTKSPCWSHVAFTKRNHLSYLRGTLHLKKTRGELSGHLNLWGGVALIEGPFAHQRAGARRRDQPCPLCGKQHLCVQCVSARSVYPFPPGLAQGGLVSLAERMLFSKDPAATQDQGGA